MLFTFELFQVDATALQFQNQKLVQQLDLQKKHLYDVETKIGELQINQTSYDDELISVNRLWNQVSNYLVLVFVFLSVFLIQRVCGFVVCILTVQLVDDLVLLGVRAGANQEALKHLDFLDKKRGII